MVERNTNEKKSLSIHSFKRMSENPKTMETDIYYPTCLNEPELCVL